MQTIKHFAVMALAAVLVAGPLSACNALKGVGRNIRSAGNAIADATTGK